MARFTPPNKPREIPRSESDTWDALSQLDDQWQVFHSVAWQAIRGRRQGDGEADFVLLHPSFGLIVLEVKGGRFIGVKDGQFFTFSHGSEKKENIKNPYEQAKLSKYTLLERLKLLGLGTTPVMYATVFPSADVARRGWALWQ